jgi:putative tricarboxylic transport membrane protein
MRVGPYWVSVQPGALIIPALFFGYGMYQFLYVRQLPDSEINLVLIKPVFFLMIVSTLCILVRTVKIRKEHKTEETGGSLLSQRTAKMKQNGTFIVISCLYVVLIPVMGFILTNLAFMVVCMLFLGERGRKVLIILPVMLTAAVYLLFEVWLETPLPKGFIGNLF